MRRTDKKSQQDRISPFLSHSAPKMRPVMDCALNFRRLTWRDTSVLWWQSFVNLQISWWHSQVPWCRHSARTNNTRSKSSPGKHKRETDPLLPSPSPFPLKNTRCPNPKPPCLQESQFDCRCFIFLVHHTNHSWPCAIIACFSLRSPPSAAIYIQGCAALITEPFVTNTFQDG